MCIKDGLKVRGQEELDKDRILKCLYSCGDLTEEEIEDIIERTEDIESEFVENVGNDTDSYWQYTCYDENGFMVAVFEVYACRDYVNLLEYEELM